MTERRTHQRSRAFHRGTIAFPDVAASDCVVRDVSDGGARLLLDDASVVPADIAFDAPHGGGLRRAHIVWRAGATVGIVYAAAVEDRPAPSRVVSLDAARRVRCADSDADRLADRIARVTRPRAGARPFWIGAEARH